MRLINTSTLQLAGPFLPVELPRYAILSHTWGPDELCHQDMADISRHRHKKGYIKIKRFCEYALEAGYAFGWVDTVCIDKTSSAELSEAINSMYRWYAKAGICYAVMEDLYTDGEPTTLSELEKCKWFTRGWTLQELLAPKDVILLDADWTALGSKMDVGSDGVGSMIKEITGIDRFTLLGYSARRLSISQRMSWASRRQTSRPEDIAYSLFGLFGITMPLLYGEGGEKAFIRLQEEILRNTDDHTIFAWSTEEVCNSIGSKYCSLLAPSPACFGGISTFIPIRGSGARADHAITSRGVHLKALTNSSCTELMLNCRPAYLNGRLCTIPIARLRSGPNDFARVVDSFEPELIPFSEVKKGFKETEIYVRNNICEDDFSEQHLVNYMQIEEVPSRKTGYVLRNWSPSSRYDPNPRIIQTSPFPQEACGAVLIFRKTASAADGGLAVAIFGESTSDETDCISQDFVGVYETTKYADDFYDEDFADWFRGGKRGELPGTAKRIVRDGLEAWRLKDGTFVRVAINRDSDLFVGTMAVAKIHAGSWEQILRGPDIED